MSKVVYLHFSSRRPNNEAFGMFSVACYADYEAKKLLTKEVTALELWDDSQHISAIQSYYNALDYIYRHQAEMQRVGITNVMLVTNNSTLVKWILNEGRNKYYIHWVDFATKQFRFGQKKEIVLGVGLLNARDTEKSKQYCLLKNVRNMDEITQELETKGKKKKYQLEFNQEQHTKFKTIYDILAEDEPEVIGEMKEV